MEGNILRRKSSEAADTCGVRHHSENELSIRLTVIPCQMHPVGFEISQCLDGLQDICLMPKNVLDVLGRAVRHFRESAKCGDINKIPLIPKFSDVDAVGLSAHHILRRLREIRRNL